MVTYGVTSPQRRWRGWLFEGGLDVDQGEIDNVTVINRKRA